ncbi:MAG: TlpA disulfide reductase family protein [bacterium]|nr:TlpA disulfide reductase family protein [bacterium]
MKRGIAIIVILVGVLFTSGIVIGGKGENLYSQDFTLKMANGEDMNLSDLSGNPAVVFFYNSRCGCRPYRELINRTYLFYKDSGLQVVGVGIRENPETFFKFAKDEGFSFTSGFDATREIEKNCRIYRVPVTLFVNREGKIIRKTKGYLKEDEIKAEIEELIS